jgi:hypothetical protein
VRHFGVELFYVYRSASLREGGRERAQLLKYEKWDILPMALEKNIAILEVKEREEILTLLPRQHTRKTCQKLPAYAHDEY